MTAGRRFLARVAIGLVVAAPLAAFAPGCGGDDSNSSDNGGTSKTASSGQTPTGGSSLALEADPSGALRFDKKTLEAKAGKVTIEMKNPAPVDHDVVIEGNGVEKKGPVVKDGGTSTVSADLKPGSYEFYCSVDGHEAAGMKGTLEVK